MYSYSVAEVFPEYVGKETQVALRATIAQWMGKAKGS